MWLKEKEGILKLIELHTEYDKLYVKPSTCIKKKFLWKDMAKHIKT